MPTDQDAIWRPDYAGPAPVREETASFRPTAPRPVRRTPARPDGSAAGRPDDPHLVAGPGSVQAPSGSSGGPPSGGRRRAGVSALVVAVLGVVGIASVVLLASGDPDDGADDPAATVDDRAATVGDDGDSAPLDPSSSLQSAPGDDPTGPVDPARILPSAGEPYAGADPRRLPEQISLRWSAPLVPGDGASYDRGGDPASDVTDATPEAGVDVDSSVFVIDDRFVAVVHGEGGARPAGSRLDLFDIETAAKQWSVDLPARASAFDIVGVAGDVLLVESSVGDLRLAGLEMATGRQRWVHAEAPGQVDVIGEAAGFELVAGSSLVARRPFVDTDPTLLFDPATGDSAGRLADVVIGDDASGGGDVVDGRIVQPDGDRILVTAADSDDPTIASIVPGADDVEVPASVSAVSAMSGSTMLLTGAGDVVGAELTGDEIRPAWRRTGVVQALFPTERGHVLLLATRGGAQFEVVDGRTGGTVHALTLRPGALDSFDVVGNGIVAQRVSELGPRVAALDLDGRELWSLPGDTPVVAGDGIVARVDHVADGPVLVVYGAPRAGS